MKANRQWAPVRGQSFLSDSTAPPRETIPLCVSRIRQAPGTLTLYCVNGQGGAGHRLAKRRLEVAAWLSVVITVDRTVGGVERPARR